MAATGFGAIGQAEAQQANMTFFVTSAGKGDGANLGGLDGAQPSPRQRARRRPTGKPISQPLRPAAMPA